LVSGRSCIRSTVSDGDHLLIVEFELVYKYRSVKYPPLSRVRVCTTWGCVYPRINRVLSIERRASCRIEHVRKGMPTRKVPPEMARELPGETRVGSTGKWYTSIQSTDKKKWYWQPRHTYHNGHDHVCIKGECIYGPSPYRDQLDGDLKQILDVHYPESTRSLTEFQNDCHLTRDFQCSNGPGLGSSYCERNSTGICSLKNTQNADRLTALQDPARQRHRYWKQTIQS
jgi:hypothetical protein